MVTFTVPSELRSLMRRDADRLYNALFALTSQCLKEQLAQPHVLDTEGVGFFGVMHTWTQRILYHPHIHYVVPGVGLREDGTLATLKREDYLMDWESLRDAYVRAFQAMIKAQGLMDDCPPEVWTKDWRVNIQAFGDGQNAVKYLGRYVRKTAIGNSRILAMDEKKGTVTFRYLDRAQDNLECEETVSGVEFISRYMQHVFPAKFHRLRYYGFLHSRQRGRLITLQNLTRTPIFIETNEPPPQEERRCSHCEGLLVFTDTFKPDRGFNRLIDSLWNREAVLQEMREKHGRPPPNPGARKYSLNPKPVPA